MILADYQSENTIINHIELSRLVADLPPKHRVVLVLRLAGYTQQETGLVVGVTRAAAGIIHKNAIAKLRRLFLQE